MHLDVQLRSRDNWENVGSFLFRPGVTYYISSNTNATLGYLLTNTYLHLDGAADDIRTEHRIWEQYILTHKIKSINVSHRFRLEQRFQETTAPDPVFSQRLRYFIRFLVPLTGDKKNFSEGVFAAVQNETFFNVQNKEKINNSLFDQNRVYLAGGYRFSKKMDLEAGYMNQSVNGANNNTSNHIIQLAVYTRF